LSPTMSAVLKTAPKATSIVSPYQENTTLSPASVRWFAATGGDVFPRLTGSEFERWAERLAAALCFRLDLTYIIPETGRDKTPIQDYLDRVRKYWAEHLHVENLQKSYPELKGLTTRKQVVEQVDAHVKIVEISRNGGAKMVDADALTTMFPFARMKGEIEVYGLEFLNPWLRFHWADLLDESESRWQGRLSILLHSRRPYIQQWQ